MEGKIAQRGFQGGFPSPTLPTILTVILLFSAAILTSSAFEYSGYCQKMCMWGRGGNLCKCSAVHFAGKRGSQLGDRESWGGPLALRDIGEQGLADGQDTEVAPLALSSEDDWRDALVNRLQELQKRDPGLPEALQYYLKSKGTNRVQRSLGGAKQP